MMTMTSKARRAPPIKLRAGDVARALGLDAGDGGDRDDDNDDAEPGKPGHDETAYTRGLSADCAERVTRVFGRAAVVAH